MREPEIETSVPVAGYPRDWMQPFLYAYVYSGNLASTAALFLIFPRNVFFRVKHHPGFAEAFAAAQGVVAAWIRCHCKHRVLRCRPRIWAIPGRLKFW